MKCSVWKYFSDFHVFPWNLLAMNNSIAYYISSYDFHRKGINISRHIPVKPPVMATLLTTLSYSMIVWSLYNVWPPYSSCTSLINVAMNPKIRRKLRTLNNKISRKLVFHPTPQRPMCSLLKYRLRFSLPTCELATGMLCWTFCKFHSEQSIQFTTQCVTWYAIKTL